MTNEWRCKACGTRLGIKDDDVLNVKYKDVSYQFEGTGAVVKTKCRKCGTENRGPKL